MYQMVSNIMKINTVKAMLYLGAHMNFCPYSPYLVSDLYAKRSARNATQLLWVSRKVAQRRLHFTYGHKWNFIDVCIVKPYDTFKVKNALVKSVSYITE
jgi:hypothetical protein